jgi:hypothetical protein
MSMSDNERAVREAWEWVQVRLAEPGEGVDSGDWVVRLPLLPFSQTGFDTESEAWRAANEFTEERLEQIRQVEEEIKVAKFKRNTDAASGFIAHVVVWDRILASRQSALQELKRGMK